MGWEASRKEKEEYKEWMKERAKKLFCPNEDCRDYSKKGKGNIIFVWKYGKGDTQNLFNCITCRTKFSERRETPFYDFKLEEEKILQVLRCLVEGNGVRATARIVGVDKDTVTRIVRKFGAHMKAIHDYFVKDYHLEECQLDELWSFIKKKKKI